MKHDRCKVFFPAIATMAGLHLMSVAFGTLFPLLFSRNDIVYFSIILFLFFGVMMLYEAYYLEVKDVNIKVNELGEALLSQPKGSENKSATAPTPNPRAISKAFTTVVTDADAQAYTEAVTQKKEAGTGSQLYCTNPYLHLVVLLFLADWGDRCQISAIVLTATHNVWGVAAGGAIVTAIHSL